MTTDRATQEDELGQLYLSNVDFLKNGVPASIVATFVSGPYGSLHPSLIVPRRLWPLLDTY